MSTLTFTAETHEYRTAVGVLVPSVTQMLKATGVSVDFQALPNREAIERKRDIGTALHADIHSLDDQDLDWSTVHPDVRPYVEAWAQFRADKHITPCARERMVHHPVLGYAGMLDGIFALGSSPEPVVLIDVKTGDPRSAGASFQTAAYLLAYAVEHPEAMGFARWSVQLTPERRVPYVITPYTDWQDFAVWQAIVTTYWASAQRRAA